MEGCDYEVFLSFNGSDTHKDFADSLYTALVKKGIRTYRDDGDLRVGEEIGPDLLRVIQQSKISIPILSKSYASDEWCLKELAEMMECRKRKGPMIMPIFYHVEPSEVTHLTVGYGEALLEHEKRADGEAVRKWRAALTEVGALEGWNVDKANTDRCVNASEKWYEGQLIEEVVTTVWNQLDQAHSMVSDFLVGIDNGVKEILEMIGTDTDDVKIGGIHGEDGIGKSTLAKVVFNKLSQDFSSHCVLLDVKETSHRRGIVYLQTQLISNLSKQTHPSIINGMDEGIGMIEDRFSGEKVLILLDDVDEKDQLIALLGRRSCFGPGSRILITTTKINVLSEFGVKLAYSVGEMDPDISLQLFSKHAFGEDSPPTEKMEMSREFVKMANGLPLIMEVMGSTLGTLGQRGETWDDCLVKWRKASSKGIRDKLKISYEVLDSRQQKIFLDIACLFIGYDKSMVIHFWRDHGLHPEVELEVLRSMSLIKIREDNKLWMHDQLRDLGREVVSQESQGELGKKSRLWNHEDSLKILSGMKGTESVEAVVLKFMGRRPSTFKSEHFASMSNIRFLQLDQAKLKGNFGQRLSSLRWLHWEGCPQILPAKNLGLEKLVILDLSWSKVNENWNGWREIKVKLSKPANTQHSSSKGVKSKLEGNESSVDNIRRNDDQSTKQNSLPDGGTELRIFGKIHVSSKVIGWGSNGTIVYEGKHEERSAAVKRLLRENCDVADNEIDILNKSDLHDNIVRYYGVEKEKDPDFVYLALERCTCSLDDLIQASLGSSNNPGFPGDPASMDSYENKLASARDMIEDKNLRWVDGYPSPSLRQLMRDMVLGLSQLHGLRIAHRDLKPSNVLITKNPFRAKLSDMGISKCLSENGSSLGFHVTGCGTTGWRAPEQLLNVVHKGVQSKLSHDLFSLGCVLFFCVTRGRHPFGEIIERDANIASDNINLSSVEKKLPEAHDLSSRLLSRDPIVRPEASQVLCHPFFWDSEKRLSFFRDVSDSLESEPREGNLDQEFENIAQAAFDGNWGEKIDDEVAELRGGRRTRYSGSSVRDLLRLVRNKFNHLEGDSERVKEILGSVPDGLDAYFARKVPKLLMESYKVVPQIWKEKERFKKYFSVM